MSPLTKVICQLLLVILLLAGSLISSRAATTIDAINRYAYGANIGWIDWHGVGADSPNGAIMGDYACSGHIYSANVGWITLGSGTPANGIYYQNHSANDFGVNQDGLGNLRGYAYGANIGWINFEATGSPRINLQNGKLNGCVWSANCGWISLSNSEAYVQTDSLTPGPLAPNGLPVAWLLTYFGTTNVNGNADPTDKSMTIGQDYVAGTNPTNASSVLRITGESFTPGGTTIAWQSVPTRNYYIQKTSDLTSSAWNDSGLGLLAPANGTSTFASFTDTNAPRRFYRVEAVVPLAP